MTGKDVAATGNSTPILYDEIRRVFGAQSSVSYAINMANRQMLSEKAGGDFMKVQKGTARVVTNCEEFSA